MSRTAGAGWAVPAAALVTFAWMEMLRVFFPSVLFIVGNAGETSALVMGAFALGCLLVPLVVATQFGRLSVRTVWLAGGLLLTVGRLAMLATDGGAPQAAVATAAVIGGALALVALAGGSPNGHAARTGILFGVLGSVVLHAMLGTHDLVWNQQAGARIGSTVLALALVVAVRLHSPWLRTSTDTLRGAGWPWLVLAPLLLLVPLISGASGRVAVAAPAWSNTWVTLTVVTAHGLAGIVALLAPRIGSAAAGAAGAGLTLIGTTAALQAAGLGAIGGQVATVIGLSAVVGSLHAVGGGTGPRGRATAAGGAILVFAVLAFGYYAAYDIALPINNRTILLVGAVLGAAVGALAAATGAPNEIRPRLGRPAISGAVAAVAVLAAMSVVMTTTPSPATPVPGPANAPVRVALYNVHMGFDTEGRFAADEIAAVLRGLEPDVVVLNEVDRGWLTTGSHDLLELLAGELGLPYRFAPAADEVWGNALLSRFPIAEWSVDRLPRGNDPMTRSQFAAVLDVADGQQLAVVGTHLSHRDDQGDTRLPQARSVAATAARFRERGLPTTVLGDLNAEPGAQELQIFDSLGMRGVLRPGNPTWPSWAPDEQIDHILVSPDLRSTDVSVPTVRASDHLPVAVTLERIEPQ